MNIKNKSLLITGSGGGIGQQTAIEFGKKGARIGLVGRRREKLLETKEILDSLNVWSIILDGDITKEEDCDRIVAETIYQFGKIDILVNNAGSFNSIGPIWSSNTDTWFNDVKTNIFGTYLITKKVLEDMMKLKEGIIVNINGGGATFPLPGGSAYGIGKAGVLRFTDTLSKEMEVIDMPIYTFAIGPGLVETEMTHLQSDTDLGREWLPSTKECFETGNTTEPNKCGKKIIEIIENFRPEFSGRIFDVNTNITDIINNLDNIVKEDKLTMRLI